MAFHPVEMIDYVGGRAILTSAVLCLLLAWYIRNYWFPIATNLPPGPQRIPFPFHIVPAMLYAERGLRNILDMHKKFGDLVFFHFGSRPSLLISSYALVKELLVKQADQTSGRNPTSALNEILQYDKRGIVLSQGDVWQENRRFALKALRSMGMGKRSLEHKINEEAEVLCTEFSTNRNGAFSPQGRTYNAISNVICNIAFGHRFEYSDPKFNDIILTVREVVSGNANFFQDMPAIFQKEIVKRVSKVKALIDEEVATHMKNFDANDLRDLTDMYLAEVKRSRASGESTHLSFDHFWASVIDIFIGGTETTSTMLTWAYLFLAAYPYIQKRITSEVDTIIGQGRKPAFEDRENMPYTEAFFMEVLRFRPVAPVGLPHMTTDNLNVRGYHVPKGTEIIMNIFAINHDPNVWGDPEGFRPERFLSEDGRNVLKPPEFVSFGAGRRVCLGEQLAKMEAFLFLTNLVQRFTFKLPQGEKPNFDIGRAMPILFPQPYKLVLTGR